MRRISHNFGAKERWISVYSWITDLYSIDYLKISDGMVMAIYPSAMQHEAAATTGIEYRGECLAILFVIHIAAVFCVAALFHIAQFQSFAQLPGALA